MTLSDIQQHNLSLGQLVTVTFTGSDGRSRRSTKNSVHGIVTSINDRFFTLQTALGAKSFLLVDLFINGKDQIKIEHKGDTNGQKF